MVHWTVWTRISLIVAHWIANLSTNTTYMYNFIAITSPCLFEVTPSVNLPIKLRHNPWFKINLKFISNIEVGNVKPEETPQDFFSTLYSFFYHSAFIEEDQWQAYHRQTSVLWWNTSLMNLPYECSILPFSHFSSSGNSLEVSTDHTLPTEWYEQQCTPCLMIDIKTHYVISNGIKFYNVVEAFECNFMQRSPM